MILSRSDVVCLINGNLFRIGDNDWLASDSNILLNIDRDSLLLNQDGLLDHGRLRLHRNTHLHILLRHGGVHLLTRLHGLLGLLRLGSLLSFLFVVLDLFLLAVDDNHSNHDIDGHSNNELESENDVHPGLEGITRIARKVAAVNHIFEHSDTEDEET